MAKKKRDRITVALNTEAEKDAFVAGLFWVGKYGEVIDVITDYRDGSWIVIPGFEGDLKAPKKTVRL